MFVEQLSINISLAMMREGKSSLNMKRLNYHKPCCPIHLLAHRGQGGKEGRAMGQHGVIGAMGHRVTSTILAMVLRKILAMVL